MTYQLIVEDQETRCESFNDLIELIRGQVSYWNNFNQDERCFLLISHLETDGSDLQVKVADGIYAEDIIR